MAGSGWLSLDSPPTCAPRPPTLGRLGAQLIATPRSTGPDPTRKWLAAGRVAAVVAGAYSVSSNRVEDGFGGHGSIIGPDGDILTSTNSDTPIATLRWIPMVGNGYPKRNVWIDIERTFDVRIQ